MGHCIDFLPTFLDLAGIKKEDITLPAGAPALPGMSLVPAFERNGAVERSHIFFHHEGNRALRAGNWKAVNESNVNRGTDKDPWALYDLSKDRCEMNDLSRQMPDRLKEMQALWQKCEKKYRTIPG
jgi:arylsulfatase A-like enzyme